MNHLRITEIFHSLQGEARDVGWPTVFVRLTGCPLRCSWCDTSYAFQGGESLSLDSILDQVAEYNCRHVCVTGGEPLAQKHCHELLHRLCDAGYQVSIETSGALAINEVDERVVRVMDLKAPGSGEVKKNLYSNIEQLRDTDQVKIVLADRQDFDWARDIISKYDLPSRCEVLFSPVHGQLAPRDLAEWILAEGLDVRMQIQLHKLIWGDVPGH